MGARDIVSRQTIAVRGALRRVRTAFHLHIEVRVDDKGSDALTGRGATATLRWAESAERSVADRDLDRHRKARKTFVQRP